jgi:hypothetical protein
MADEPASPATPFPRQIAGPPTGCDLADRHLLERFVTARDEAAFATLVQRHGPMVLGGSCLPSLGVTKSAQGGLGRRVSGPLQWERVLSLRRLVVPEVFASGCLSWCCAAER